MKISPFFDLTSQLAYTPPAWASLVCGILVLITLTLSIYLLFEHLSAYKNPEVFISYWIIYTSLYINCAGFSNTIFVADMHFLICVCIYLSGTKVFNWCHPHGSMLCSRVGKVFSLFIFLYICVFLCVIYPGGIT